MRRALALSLLLLTATPIGAALPALASPPPAADDDAPLAVKDWPELARALNGVAMIRTVARLGTPEELTRLYDEAVRFAAPGEPLDLARFRALPAATRQQRREMAESYRGRARQFETVMRQAADTRRQGFTLVDPPGAGEGLTRLLGALVTATGLDPSDPALWYDLAYAQGAVGDCDAQARSLDAALAAMAPLPLQRCAALRRRVLLDQAWLCRERGLYAEGLAVIAAARATGAPWDASAREESLLIEGLLLAGSGQFAAACRLAADLRAVRVHVANWGWLDSDYAERWIKSAAYVERGDRELASFVMGRIYTHYGYPQAHRLFNDVGLLCELNGQRELAAEYYGLALLYRPLASYFPVGMRVGPARVFGFDGLDRPFAEAYGRFRVAGSPLAHAAQLVLACGQASAPAARQRWGEPAIGELTDCQRRGIRPAVALALRGRVHHHLGNAERAAADLALACDLLTARGEDAPGVCSLAGVLEVSLGGGEQALPRLARSLAARPGDAAGWNALGVAASRAGRTDAAREAFATAIGIAPDAAAGWYNRGLLNFNARRWAAAGADLEIAVQLAPELAEAASLLDRAHRAVAAGAAPAEPPAPGPAPPPAAAPEPAPASAAPAWSALLPTDGAFDDEATPDPVAKMYSSRVFEGIARAGGARDPGEAAAPTGDLGEVVRTLEQACASEPTRSNTRDLALAYVRSGEADRGRALLLPRWATGIDPGEMCVVLEADRALGEPRRARDMVRALREAPSELADPHVWALAAFICFDAGLNEEGLTALDRAIILDPDNQPLKMQRRFYGERP